MTWKNNEIGSSHTSNSGLAVNTGAGPAELAGEHNDIAATPGGKNLCLHDLFDRQALQTPHNVALVYEDQRLTYRDLAQRADRLAHRLRGMGAGPDVVVALLVERSLDMIAGILGILKAGAGYLPIDPALPQERIAFMLEDSSAALVLTQSGLLSVLPSAAQSICLDSFDWDQPASSTDETPCHPRNLAYVIYTSGSTGRPKGVCIEHRNIVSYVLGVAQRLQLEPGMNHATVSTIAADLGNTVIFPALATGGCLHVISQERAENQALLAEYFLRENIDVLKIVPSHLSALQTGRNPEQVMPKKRLILGGEASRLEWVARLRHMAPDCEIYNHYGPTETTVGVLTYHVSSQTANTQSGTLPLGSPLPNTSIYILDGAGQPVPAGERGELCIGGSGVARGYLNRPELSAQMFVPDPFSADSAARMYRTGDLARCLSDGNFEFCGRIDDQVKLHGYRVELGEIDCALREKAGIRDAVTLAPEDESGNRQLVAYVVPKRAVQALWAFNQVHVLPDGAAVAHLNRNETDYIYNEIFILQAYLRHGISIRDGDCIVDAGSNIGLFTVFANRLARNLRMLSFEPNPAAYACLKANAETWGTAVKCLPFGLSRDNKSAELTFFQGLSLLSGFYADTQTEREMVKTYVMNQQQPDPAHSEHADADIGALIDDRLQSRIVTAQLRTLSSVMAEEGIDHIDLLKINVEKSELDVLLGINAEDWPKIRQMVIEVDQQANLAPINALLEKHGYDFVVEQDPLLRNTDLCYVYAIRPSQQGRLIREQAADGHLLALPPVDEEILTPAALRKHLKARLPQYMVPSAFVLMEKFPLNANGKIDRKAFPAFVGEKPSAARAAVAPQTETEKELALIWAELLNVENIGAHDDFFDLGGHSLLAIRAVSRIREKFDVNLSLRNLLESPTLEGLAQVIDGLSWVKRSQGAAQEAGNREEIAL
jgi:amino acid adenylation domain-containing protein/FkbM family methyltransferase